MGNDSSIDALETTPLARDADGRRVALVDEASAPSTGLPVLSVLLLLWWTGVAVALTPLLTDITLVASLEIFALDEDARTIDLKRGVGSETPHAATL